MGGRGQALWGEGEVVEGGGGGSWGRWVEGDGEGVGGVCVRVVCFGIGVLVGS